MPNVTKDSDYSLEDPFFVDPGNGENGYFITEGSSAEGLGINFDQPAEDYFGNIVGTNNLNAGVYQGILAEPNDPKNIITSRAEIIEDAHTRGNGSNADVNYGSADLVEIKDVSTTLPRIGMLKFNLPDGLSSVLSAKIKVYASISTVPEEEDTFKFYEYPNNWSETTLTENNRPAIGNEIASVTIFGTTGEYAWYSIDITDYFNNNLSSSELSVAVQAVLGADGGFQSVGRITSKEGAEGTGPGTTAPYIEIETSSTLSADDFDRINKNELIVYPNPVSSNFNLQIPFKNSDEISVSFFDLQGRKIAGFKELVYPGVWQKSLNKNDLGLNRGIYLIKVSSESLSDMSSKIIVD